MPTKEGKAMLIYGTTDQDNGHIYYKFGEKNLYFQQVRCLTLLRLKCNAKLITFKINFPYMVLMIFIV